MNSEFKYQIRSGGELVNSPIPDVDYRILDLLRANGGRLALVGQYKMGKSLLAHDLAFKVTAGEEWLGFKTMESKVLYVNLEISKESFQSRTQDVQSKYGYGGAILERFRETTILDENLDLDKSIDKILYIIEKCEEDGFNVDVLVLDPRARCISGSENEEVLIKSFCQNVDTLLKRNSKLSVIIVTHMGKDVTKGAIGHSRFSGWLDTEIKITRDRNDAHKRAVEIIGRDCEAVKFSLDFEYPLFKVVPDEEAERQSKVKIATKFIVEKLSIEPNLEQELKTLARKNEITDYAFNTAIRELKDNGKIEAVQSEGKGHRKLLKLIETVRRPEPLKNSKNQKVKMPFHGTRLTYNLAAMEDDEDDDDSDSDLF